MSFIIQRFCGSYSTKKDLKKGKNNGAIECLLRSISCSVQSCLLFLFHGATNVCVCVCAWAYKEDGGRLRNASTSTDDRTIHLRRMTERMDQACLCVCLPSLFSSDMPFLFLLILSIYYPFSPFLSHSTIGHVSSREFKMHSTFAYLFDRK